ncbi:unnamed protein product [Linum tenue]|uniref:Alcohol dehydrogenase-like C-terminal domain-containing protein n=1 Tax=Linum tenue TaxID=586396 RepID=A0AAV0HB01_9ROSI|nr:unnamed protein product [Linum tenue]
MDAATPLSCAGITVFTPLRDHDLIGSPRKKVGVVGLGGLGHATIKFGKVFGHHVTVISTSPSKEKEARDRLCADDFIVRSNLKQMEVRKLSLDFILDTVSDDHSLGPILELLKVNGTMVIVRASSKSKSLAVRDFPGRTGKRLRLPSPQTQLS